MTAVEPPLMDGAALIALERAQQKLQWSDDHDDKHLDGALAVAAAVLAVWDTDASVKCEDFDDGDGNWWATDLGDKNVRTPIHRLVIAGALIAAEIDRLLRARA